MDPFADLRGHRRTRTHNSSASRHAPPQQASLFDNFFSPMRMPATDHDVFRHGVRENNLGNISSFNILFGFVPFKCKISLSRYF